MGSRNANRMRAIILNPDEIRPHIQCKFYRPQRKVMFSQACVSHSVHNRPHGYLVTAQPYYSTVGMHPTGMLLLLKSYFRFESGRTDCVCHAGVNSIAVALIMFTISGRWPAVSNSTTDRYYSFHYPI